MSVNESRTNRDSERHAVFHRGRDLTPMEDPWPTARRPSLSAEFSLTMERSGSPLSEDLKMMDSRPTSFVPHTVLKRMRAREPVPDIALHLEPIEQPMRSCLGPRRVPAFFAMGHGAHELV